MAERQDRPLTPREVAILFRVETKTVSKWANAGRRLTGVHTPGGHWRFREFDVREWMRQDRSGGEV
jgi:excisionase family DNA binding protein